MVRALPSDQVSEFGIDELFFSITDRRGIILASNDTFVRISKFTEPELIGMPHNIIRHPHMPKLVFRVLWNTIGAGKPVAAYVKNMAKDGSYYWVFATVYPVPQGYLSIRLKPSSAYFQLIPDLYAKLLEIEKSSKTEWFELGLAALLKALGEKGFPSYESFMISALTEELRSRARVLEGLGRTGALKSIQSGSFSGGADLPGNDEFLILEELTASFFKHFQALFSTLERFTALESTLSQKSKFIVNLAEVISIASMNASFKSGQLGVSGRTLAVVARELTGCANEVKKRVRVINGYLAELKHKILRIQFQVSSARYQVEMISLFIAEVLQSQQGTKSNAGAASKGNGQERRAKDSSETLAHCHQLLHALNGSFGEASQELVQFVSHARDLENKIQSLNGFVTQLEIIRKTGLMEAVKVRESGESFVSLFEQVAQASGSAERELEEFFKLLSDTRASIESFSADQGTIGGKLGAALQLVRLGLEPKSTPSPQISTSFQATL